jgi:hypothetical protein
LKELFLLLLGSSDIWERGLILLFLNEIWERRFSFSISISSISSFSAAPFV